MLHLDEVGEGHTQRPQSRGSVGLSIALAAVLATLGAWVVFGATHSSDPAAFLVASTPDPVPPLSATGSAGSVLEADPAGGSVSSPQAAAIPNRDLGNSAYVDRAWATRTASATGIPIRAVLAYGGAELAMATTSPGCGVRWNTLAALGSIESAHGTHGGSSIDVDGVTRPGIFGIDLTGESSARITDTDAGVWDGKDDVDRAVGPMQFIPATWETWGADGNGDGIRDPQQIDDAVLAAAGYLCHYGDLSSAETWRAAIFAYNHLDSYVNAVTQAASDYAERAG